MELLGKVKAPRRLLTVEECEHYYPGLAPSTVETYIGDKPYLIGLIQEAVVTEKTAFKWVDVIHLLEDICHRERTVL